MHNNLWRDDRIQFARLITELEQIDTFTPSVTTTLATNMDLEEQHISELLERASTVMDESVALTP